MTRDLGCCWSLRAVGRNGEVGGRAMVLTFQAKWKSIWESEPYETSSSENCPCSPEVRLLYPPKTRNAPALSPKDMNILNTWQYTGWRKMIVIVSWVDPGLWSFFLCLSVSHIPDCFSNGDFLFLKEGGRREGWREGGKKGRKKEGESSCLIPL